jgi:hypothetical protein
MRWPRDVSCGSSAGMQSKRSARLLSHLKLPKLLHCRPDACPQDTRSQASSETIGAQPTLHDVHEAVFIASRVHWAGFHPS